MPRKDSYFRVCSRFLEKSVVAVNIQIVCSFLFGYHLNLITELKLFFSGYIFELTDKVWRQVKTHSVFSMNNILKVNTKRLTGRWQKIISTCFASKDRKLKISTEDRFALVGSHCWSCVLIVNYFYFEIFRLSLPGKSPDVSVLL